MATVRKLDGGKWQAQIARKGVRKSKTFRTKGEARDWANQQEHLIVEGNARSAKSSYTIADLCNRYAREVSPNKRGAHWEIMRLDAMARSPFGTMKIRDFTSEEAARWRDWRLQSVAPGTVQREKNLLSVVFTTAIQEWKLTHEHPFRGVKMPPQPPGRDRRITEKEIQKILNVAGTDTTRISGRVGLAFLFAIETAMRAGEIAALTWDDINQVERTAHLPKTKNGTARDVPLSSAALDILKQLGADVFNLTAMQISSNFKRLRLKTDIDDLVFHDTRHEAITRLSRKMHVLALARIVGHRDVRQLQTYYNESAADIAKLLD